MSRIVVRALRHGRVRIAFTVAGRSARLVIKVTAGHRALARRTKYVSGPGRRSVVLRLARTARGRRAAARRQRVKVALTATGPGTGPVHVRRAARLRR